MSSSTAIPISPALEQSFKNGSARYFVVRIENEVLIQDHMHPKGASIASDWGTIAHHADNRACYILFETAPRSWMTITFVPPGTKIRDKMIYAATKATLLNHLGFQHFTDELHANDNSELDYQYFVESQKPVNALSATEEIHNQILQQENEERNFRATMPPGGRNPGSPSTAKGIGGYHGVSMPFDASAENLVRSIINGTNTFVELAINPEKTGIIGVKGKNGSVASLASDINTDEPRYYLIKNAGQNALVYCCPAKSPQKLRMVYSTAKASVRDTISNLGFSVNKTGEITEASELTASLVSELSRSTGSPATRPFGSGPTRAAPGAGQNKAQRQSVMTGAHPIYSLMGDNNSGRSKKIVLPPPGAY